MGRPTLKSQEVIQEYLIVEGVVRLYSAEREASLVDRGIPYQRTTEFPSHSEMKCDG